jgi:hypothetical protein
VIILKRKKEDKEKFKITTVSIWKPFYDVLQAIKENDTRKRNRKSMSEVVRRCLSSGEINLTDILEKEEIKIKIVDFTGFQILTLNLPESIYHKMKLIKKINPVFSSSSVVNLCLMYQSFTVNSFLGEIDSQKAVLSRKSKNSIPAYILKAVKKINKEKVSIKNSGQ